MVLLLLMVLLMLLSLLLFFFLLLLVVVVVVVGSCPFVLFFFFSFFFFFFVLFVELAAGKSSVAAAPQKVRWVAPSLGGAFPVVPPTKRSAPEAQMAGVIISGCDILRTRCRFPQQGHIRFLNSILWLLSEFHHELEKDGMFWYVS